MARTFDFVALLLYCMTQHNSFPHMLLCSLNAWVIRSLMFTFTFFLSSLSIPFVSHVLYVFKHFLFFLVVFDDCHLRDNLFEKLISRSPNTTSNTLHFSDSSKAHWKNKVKIKVTHNTSLIEHIETLLKHTKSTLKIKSEQILSKSLNIQSNIPNHYTNP